jgi:hypothetical protein
VADRARPRRGLIAALIVERAGRRLSAKAPRDPHIVGLSDRAVSVVERVHRGGRRVSEGGGGGGRQIGQPLIASAGVLGAVILFAYPPSKGARRRPLYFK